MRKSEHRKKSVANNKLNQPTRALSLPGKDGGSEAITLTNTPHLLPGTICTDCARYKDTVELPVDDR